MKERGVSFGFQRHDSVVGAGSSTALLGAEAVPVSDDWSSQQLQGRFAWMAG